MRIVVTGGDGFIGTNLRVRLREAGHEDVLSVTRGTGEGGLRRALAEADFVYHLAGVNRPRDEREFETGNAGLTRQVCGLLLESGRPVPLAFSSSTQAALDNPYGRSKLAAERAVERYGEATGAPVYILRLTNVFGKWCRPGYNSVVATFCHNLTRGLPVRVDDPEAPLELLYIDDAVECMLGLPGPPPADGGRVQAGPTHSTTVGELLAILERFRDSRDTAAAIPPVGRGLARALYATYQSYLLPADFGYALRAHADERGTFVEMLRTDASGQLSYFTAAPGVTRGGHYHHSKVEKFLVLGGRARFGFRHVLTGERHELVVQGGEARVVETVPGWIHDVTNIGEAELVVMLWASEVFDPARPDAVPARVER